MSSRNHATDEPTGARTLSPACTSITISPPGRANTGTSTSAGSRARFSHTASVATGIACSRQNAFCVWPLRRYAAKIRLFSCALLCGLRLASGAPGIFILPVYTSIPSLHTMAPV